jgi:hypothetical protein
MLPIIAQRGRQQKAASTHSHRHTPLVRLLHWRLSYVECSG